MWLSFCNETSALETKKRSQKNVSESGMYAIYKIRIFAFCQILIVYFDNKPMRNQKKPHRHNLFAFIGKRK